MRVEIWSDVICPWCYVGKRRFEAALAAFPHRDQVDVVWRAFELDPHAPAEREGDPTDYLAAKYGVPREQAEAMIGRVARVAEEEGLHLELSSIRRGNTFDAHRLLALAGEAGPEAQGRLKERFLQAFFVESEAIGRPEVLARLAGEAGLPAGEVADVLAGDRHADDVRRAETEAAALGCTGVPFFVADRAYGVAGAQSTEVFAAFLDRAWNAGTAVEGGADAEACPI